MTSTASTKIYRSDVERAKELAKRFEVVNSDVISASLDVFEAETVRRKRESIERARRRHPRNGSRTGRGNRIEKAAA